MEDMFFSTVRKAVAGSSDPLQGAWSQVLDKADLGGGLGALRLRLVATKNRPCADFPYKGADGKHAAEVVLDFDYTALMPRRG